MLEVLSCGTHLPFICRLMCSLVNKIELLLLGGLSEEHLEATVLGGNKGS